MAHHNIFYILPLCDVYLEMIKIKASPDRSYFLDQTTSSQNLSSLDFLQLSNNKKELLKIIKNDPKCKAISKNKKLQDMNGHS